MQIAYAPASRNSAAQACGNMVESRLLAWPQGNGFAPVGIPLDADERRVGGQPEGAHDGFVQQADVGINDSAG